MVPTAGVAFGGSENEAFIVPVLSQDSPRL